MPEAKTQKLIINSPYNEPSQHWSHDRDDRRVVDGRRSAGYVIASHNAQAFDDPGHFVPIPRVNQIRQRVGAWRKAGYPGTTSVTRHLLRHWLDIEKRSQRFFFCQIEAIETLIWLTEGPAADRVGIDIPSDGGPYQRLCAKMATGSGKTVVMAMAAAWHILNKVASPKDRRFSSNILVVAPGLTVKSRLAVLDPSHPDNYYDAFDIVPSRLEKLRRGQFVICNWHALNWETRDKLAGKRSVDKRGPRSDEAYVRDVLGGMARARNILVINDEAHHAWRVTDKSKAKGVAKEDIEKATKWIDGLDRIHRSRNILSCYDFSATPFTPSGKQSSEEALFSWIVSDFGLDDAIESGLVKTPRVVIRDDAKPDPETDESRFNHIYSDHEVKDDLNRKALPEEPLPDLVVNAYYLLGYDWRETAKQWQKSDAKTPPVMITVANRTETAARIKYAFDHSRIHIEELCDPERTLHIDSKVLKEAEAVSDAMANFSGHDAYGGEDSESSHTLTKKQQTELLRQQVDTIGRQGKVGEQIQNVISVGMLSEGWDAKTVTHIMGLRAFSSQLLCEQVVGRGLRRASYETDSDGRFAAEYVNVFGIPFTFLPHESEEINGNKNTQKPKIAIEPVASKSAYEISWPNVIRIERTFRPHLSLDWEKLRPFKLDVGETSRIAELAPVVAGTPNLTQIKRIDLITLARECRMQRIIFEAARDVFAQMQPNWKGGKATLLGQLVHLIEQFMVSEKISIEPPQFADDQIMKRLLLTLNMTKLVQHIWVAIRTENAEKLVPVFDQDRTMSSTGDMRVWYTGKPCVATEHSHINYCVCDSDWEGKVAHALERSREVSSWVKNDHLDFEITYIHRGVVRRYIPDFLIRMASGNMLILEVKGDEQERDKSKFQFLEEWVLAVNMHSESRKWRCDMLKHPDHLNDILLKHSTRSDSE